MIWWLTPYLTMSTSLFTWCFGLKVTLTNLLLSGSNSSICATCDLQSSKTTVFSLPAFGITRPLLLLIFIKASYSSGGFPNNDLFHFKFYMKITQRFWFLTFDVRWILFCCYFPKQILDKDHYLNMFPKTEYLVQVSEFKSSSNSKCKVTIMPTNNISQQFRFWKSTLENKHYSKYAYYGLCPLISV